MGKAYTFRKGDKIIFSILEGREAYGFAIILSVEKNHVTAQMCKEIRVEKESIVAVVNKKGVYTKIKDHGMKR